MTLRWHKQTDCPDVPGCDCPEPSSPPSYVGQTVNTDCGGSSSSSPDSPSSEPSGGSSGSPSSGPCFVGTPPEPCTGTCQWTADVHYVTGTPIVWGVTSSNCSPALYPCQCVLPSRSPDFIGDTETTDCGCCQGCQWEWLPSPFNFWQRNPDVGTLACQPAVYDCGGDCPAPTHDPGCTYNCPSVITGCGGPAPSAGSPASSSSSSP